MNYAGYLYTGVIEEGQTYYWRVDEVEADGETIYTGVVWSFTGVALKAYGPSPEDGATDVPSGLILSWEAGKDAVGQQLYFGTDESAVVAGDASVDQGILEETEFNTGGLRIRTKYYWRVDTVTATDVVEGDVWSFTTEDVSGPANKIMYEYWLDIDGADIELLTQ